MKKILMLTIFTVIGATSHFIHTCGETNPKKRTLKNTTNVPQIKKRTAQAALADKPIHMKNLEVQHIPLLKVMFNTLSVNDLIQLGLPNPQAMHALTIAKKDTAIAQWIHSYTKKESKGSNICIGLTPDEKKVVGFIAYHANTTQDSHQKEKNNVEIHAFAIAPEYRNQGNGQYIMEAMKYTLQESNYDTIQLDTRKENVAASSLYHACGFRSQNTENDPTYDYMVCNLQKYPSRLTFF